MDDMSDRLALPLLAAGQAQKELTHNEALIRLDMLVQPVVEELGRNDPPEAPARGACWIAGAAPSGPWAGNADALACWTGGGWRFVRAFPGLSVRDRAGLALATYCEGGWRVCERSEAIADPTGGPVVDAEARVALAAVLDALRRHGLIAA